MFVVWTNNHKSHQASAVYTVHSLSAVFIPRDGGWLGEDCRHTFHLIEQIWNFLIESWGRFEDSPSLLVNLITSGFGNLQNVFLSLMYKEFLMISVRCVPNNSWTNRISIISYYSGGIFGVFYKSIYTNMSNIFHFTPILW